MLSRFSLRGILLTGILLPIVVVISINALMLHRETLTAVNTAYDRTLLASAKSIGEHLNVEGFDENARLRSSVPYAALEAFEAGIRTNMYYRVSSPAGGLVAGFVELPMWQGKLPDRSDYGALVDFYDSSFQGKDVRVAVLLQPVVSEFGRGMAVIQVAETLELRQDLTRAVLTGMLWRQTFEIFAIFLVVVLAIEVATRPVRKLSVELRQRPEGDLTPVETSASPRELKPLLDATNDVMSRLQHLLDHQKRFVRDAAHQLRTPLAVLKTQVQSAIRKDVDSSQALNEINRTVDRATTLTNQMLSLAKVEQLRHEQDAGDVDFCRAAKEASVELTPLILDKEIDFEFDGAPAMVRGHHWMLRELVQNLLHNALKHTPMGGAIVVRVFLEKGHACLTVSDSGPGIPDGLKLRLFQPFFTGDVRGGSGLGLTICHEIVRTLQGSIDLQNRCVLGPPGGFVATVRLPTSMAGSGTS